MVTFAAETPTQPGWNEFDPPPTVVKSRFNSTRQVSDRSGLCRVEKKKTGFFFWDLVTRQFFHTPQQHVGYHFFAGSPAMPNSQVGSKRSSRSCSVDALLARSRTPFGPDPNHYDPPRRYDRVTMCGTTIFDYNRVNNTHTVRRGDSDIFLLCGFYRIA